MNFADFRKVRERQSRPEPKERRPKLTSQEERFLYSMHLKTIELRALMTTLRAKIPREELDEILIDYWLRLRKAKKNFEQNNWNDDWYEGVKNNG